MGLQSGSERAAFGHPAFGGTGFDAAGSGQDSEAKELNPSSQSDRNYY
jgi:hypothetical protein